MLYQIEFHSFWHMGTGMAATAQVDNLIIKDRRGLPIIPGKTVKGLLRDAAQQLSDINSKFVSPTFIEQIFGAQKEDSAKSKHVSPCHFATARPAKELADEIIKLGQKQHLYETFASTRIDANGMAEDYTLREIELTVPLVLFGEIVNFPKEEEMTSQLHDTMKFIKRMGAHRHRGLGRCTWTLLNESDKPDA